MDKKWSNTVRIEHPPKKTSIGGNNARIGSGLNKGKKRSYKKYRGQGR